MGLGLARSVLIESAIFLVPGRPLVSVDLRSSAEVLDAPEHDQLLLLLHPLLPPLDFVLLLDLVLPQIQVLDVPVDAPRHFVNLRLSSELLHFVHVLAVLAELVLPPFQSLIPFQRSNTGSEPSKTLADRYMALAEGSGKFGV